MKTDDNNQGIAIIGMSCRFPGAKNPEKFWELIAKGQNRFENIPQERLNRLDFSSLKVPLGTFLEHPFHFDNSYFKISENEAMAMDPQQRILLELALEAKENAAIESFIDRNVGVFIGANQRAYVESICTIFYRQQLINEVKKMNSLNGISPNIKKEIFTDLSALENTHPVDSTMLTGNISNMLSNRISHEFNLFGPSLTIDTACSSSLVAIHLACESLYKKECNLVYAGGINLNLTPSIFLMMEAAEVISPSGQCIPFSDESDGILLGEGAGLVLLKRVEDAIKDGDQILAVIKGSGINNDGRSLGVMAPNWKGQLRLLESVYAGSNYDPSKISLIEAHGTSTRIGDSVEITVLENFFAQYKNNLSIGSVKSNIGHLLGASGIAGLIKTVLAIKNRKLPPSLFGKKVNSKWNLKEKGYKIQDKLEDWESENLLAAGVSSFGFGGTNAHLIIEEPFNIGKLSRPMPVNTLLKHKKFDYDLFPGLSANEHSTFLIKWDSVIYIESEQEFNPHRWLIFCDENHATLKAVLKKSDLQCVWVQPGANFMRIDEFTFEINPADENHLRWLFEGLEKDKKYGLLYSPFRNDLEDVSVTLKEILFIKHLFKNGLNLLPESRAWCVSYSGYQTFKQEYTSPHQHALSSFFSAALNENIKMLGGIVDLNIEIESDVELLPQLIRQYHAAPIIVRKTQVLKPFLAPIDGHDPASKDFAIKNNGVYLILGGSSGIGKEIAKHINDKFSVKIILSGLRQVGELSDELRTFLDKNIEYVPTSVTDKEALKKLIEGIYIKYGKLNGIFFSAGVISYGTIKTITDQDFEHSLKVKLNGVQNLYEAISGYEVDFVYLISSVTSISPSWAIGMAGYAAANAYLNQFAMRSTSQSTKWISRSWTIWEDIGMSKNKDISSSYTLIPLRLQRALEMFDRSLQLDQVHLVIISKLDAKNFSNQWTIRKEIRRDNRSIKQPGSEIFLSDINPDDIKLVIKKLISEASELQVSEIVETESFSNLGVDSISALDIVSVLETEYKMSLSPTLLFEYDTINRLTEYLAKTKEGRKTKSFTLLPAQKTFYSNYIFFPESPCNSMVKMTFNRQFDFSVLGTAWRILSKRHVSLRLSFAMTDDGPEQKIDEEISATIEYIQIKKEENTFDLIRDQEKRMLNKIYSLDKAPLCDLCYIDIEDTAAMFIFSAHHIITDAWSMTVILRDLIELCTKIAEGVSTPKTENAHLFSDYVNHINSKTKGLESERSKEYWKNELLGFKPFNFPYKTPVDSENKIESCTFIDVLDAKSTSLLEIKAKHENVTLFHLLVSGYFKLLNDITGQNNLVIRLATENRDRSFGDINDLTGCLADSIPLRIQLDEHEGLVSICNKVKEKLILAGKFNTLSSIDYASILNSRSQSGPVGISPFGMSYINVDYFTRGDEKEQPIVEVRAALPFTDLSLICLKQKNTLHFSWNYSSTNFDSETINELRSAYIKALFESNSVENSTRNVTHADTLKMPEKILFPQQTLLHEKVFAACNIFRNQTAINDDGNVITYSELKTKSIQIANTIIRSGNNLGEAIGILEYPGANGTTGILGILAAGCAYIPLDPDWPIGRIEDIVSHSGIEVILTTSFHLKEILENQKILRQLKTIVLLDDSFVPYSPNENLNIFSYSKEPQKKLLPLPKIISPNHLAYIMYTSGTTGIPKGVMVEHQSVAIFLSWISEEFDVNSNDKFISTSSLGFGGSIRQIFSTLLAGGEMHPIERYDFKDPKTLLQFLDEREITIINTVPSVLQNICQYLDQLGTDESSLQLGKLRLMLIGGEILHSKLVQKWRMHFGSSQRIVNLYGSTETIVNATFHDVAAESIIPIGKPRDGSHVLLLNENNSPCNENEKGELYVGGPSIARGYYKAEEMTQKKFVYPAIYGAEGAYYRTGDIAQKDKFGIYHFLGRNDNQIQLYGNRIEPAEIELVLTSNDHIKNASVLDFKDEERHWIVAFVELNSQNKKMSEIDVRNIVARKLPSYMIPQKVEFVTDFPHTHAGKIDRLKLRNKYLLNSSPNRAEDSPTDTESIVKSIWRKVLKIENIEINHDFFSLGGDSILALEVLYNLRKAFSKTPKPVDLFRKRTITDLAKCIDELNGFSGIVNKKSNESISASNSEGDQTHFSLSYAQKGFLFLNRFNSESSPNLVSVVPVKGKVDEAIFQKALDFIVLRHPMLRTRFITEELRSYQEIISTITVLAVFKDLRRQSVEEQHEKVKEEFEKYKKFNFNLSELPLFRIEVVLLSEDSAVLLLCVHHIIGDAWSLKILANELLIIYDEISDGKYTSLPPLRTSFLNIVKEEAERNKRSSDKTIFQEEFWKKTLKGLPLNNLSKVFLTNNSGNDQVVLQFSLSQKERLKLICSAHGISLFQLIFAAYARALQKILKTNRILINTAVSRRDLSIPDIDRRIGCFARNLPVVVSPTGDDLISDIHELEKSFLLSYEYQDIPPRDLVKILLGSGSEGIHVISRFIISFMDFSGLSTYESSHISLNWDEAEFFFNSASAESELMIGVRVTDKIAISFSGKTNSLFKNKVKQYLKADLDLFMELSTHNNKVEPSLTESTELIDSALIAYFPSLKNISGSRPPGKLSEKLIKEYVSKIFPDNEPQLLEIEKTQFGITGVVFLPLFAEELSVIKGEVLLSLILKALNVCKKFGAKHISLAGNLPSRTNYCYSVNEEINKTSLRHEKLSVTTGHSCTVVAVVKTIEKVLSALDLNIHNLTVAVAGFGSIGQASLNLLFKKIGMPAKIIIADLASQMPALQKPLQELKKVYPNAIEVISVKGAIPDDFYSSNLIIGASSQGQILEVDKILPGAILVDDSFPHIVDPQKAIKRMKIQKDVLIIGGGKLDVGYKEQVILNPELYNLIIHKIVQEFNREGLPGCRIESMMMSYNSDFPLTTGLVTTKTAINYWDRLTDLGISAVGFHLQGFIADNNLIQNIKKFKLNGTIKG